LCQLGWALGTWGLVDPIHLSEDIFFHIFHCLRFVQINSIRPIPRCSHPSPPPCARRLHHRAPAASTMGRGLRRLRGCLSRRPHRPCGCQSRRACRLTSLRCRPRNCPSQLPPPQLPARPAAAPAAARRGGRPSLRLPVPSSAPSTARRCYLLPMRAGCSRALLPGPHAPSCLGLRGALPPSPRRAHAAARAAVSPEKKPLGHCSTFSVQHSNILFSQFQHFVYTISTFRLHNFNI